MSDEENDDNENADDDALWQAVIADVTPLKSVNTVKRVKPKAPIKSVKSDNKAHPVKRPHNVVANNTLHTSLYDTHSSSQIDRKTAERLRKGDIQIEARLDLHGMNQSEAHAALNRFIHASHNAGMRCVLVITGKGNTRRSSDDWLSPQPGILKRKVPEWLDDISLKPLILQSVPAKKHGGQGALYVYLRRIRE